MYDVMMTSYNCYITVIFQSFQNTFIKMHQNVNITLSFEKGKNELSKTELCHSHVNEAMYDVINNKYLHLR